MFKKILVHRCGLFIPSLIFPVQFSIFGVTFHLGFLISYILAAVFICGRKTVDRELLFWSGCIVILATTLMIFSLDVKNLKSLHVYLHVVLLPLLIIFGGLVACSFFRFASKAGDFLEMSLSKISGNFIFPAIAIFTAFLYNSRGLNLLAHREIFPFYEQYFGFEFFILASIFKSPAFVFFFIAFLGVYLENKTLVISALIMTFARRMRFIKVSEYSALVTISLILIFSLIFFSESF